MPNQLENIGIIFQVSPANEQLDPPNLEEGIDEDGIVEGHIVETYYNAFEALFDADGYLRVVGDGGFTNVEIRVPHKRLEALGWKKVVS